MMQELITVIVPVYNTEKYLERCLDSIVGQTYRDLEILLIDDGSTDSSGEICRRYAEADDRITVLVKENGGQASARNLGLDRMQGEYVLFVDSDDYVSPDFVEELYRQIKAEPGIGIADSSYVKLLESEDPGTLTEGKKPAEVYSQTEALELLLYQRKFNQSPCTKLFARSVFEGIRFPVGKGYEDLAIIYQTFAKAEKLSYGYRKGYYYLQRAGSTMHKAFDRKKLDRLTISEEILEFVKEHYPEIVKAAEARLFLSALQQLMNLPVEKELRREYDRTKILIHRYRSGILRDSKVKKSLRGMALCSYLGMPILKILGNLYDRVINRVS